MFGRRRHQRVPDATDKVLLCWRDSETGILITWGGAPDNSAFVWVPGHHTGIEVNFVALIPTDAQSLLAQSNAEGVWAAAGAIHGYFHGFCEALLSSVKTHQGVNEAIQQMEKQFKDDNP